MKITKLVAAFAITLATPPMAIADDVSLKFRFVTHDSNSTSHLIETAEDLTLEAIRSFGVAVFDDGRLAVKKYVWIQGTDDFVADGRTAYIFENGDTIIARFRAAPVGDGLAGDYEVVSGKGEYDGATGVGRFEVQDSKWDDSISWTGEFDLVLP